LVHDAARPCITATDIHYLIDSLVNDDVGGILALASPDTLKQVQGKCITGTLDRSHIWRALTPQMFRYGMLKTALEQAQGNPRLPMMPALWNYKACSRKSSKAAPTISKSLARKTWH
jgi:2-C-methyl-D-erythritol 4-phosphate cytidylyltransferase (EC 2.7.7.60)